MSTEKLARCLGELQHLLPLFEEAALPKAIAEDVNAILRTMHDYCLTTAQQRVSGIKQKKHSAGPSLADAAIRMKRA